MDRSGRPPPTRCLGWQPLLALWMGSALVERLIPLNRHHTWQGTGGLDLATSSGLQQLPTAGLALLHCRARDRTAAHQPSQTKWFWRANRGLPHPMAESWARQTNQPSPGQGGVTRSAGKNALQAVFHIPGNPGSPGIPGSPFIPFRPGRPESPYKDIKTAASYCPMVETKPEPNPIVCFTPWLEDSSNTSNHVSDLHTSLRNPADS